MGLSRREYLQYFDRVNLLPYFPGRHKRDDKFPMTPARLAAEVMAPLLVDRTVILVGRNVASAFKVEGEFHEWQEVRVRRPCFLQRCPGTARVAIVPHPSGRNHWYNQADNMAAARAFWEEFLRADKMFGSLCNSVQKDVVF